MRTFLLCMLQVTFTTAALCTGVSLKHLFRDLPKSLCSCSQVKCDPSNQRILEMHFKDSNLNGTIPDEFGQVNLFGDLQVLDLCKNNLHGELPKSLPSLGQLEVLCVGFNSLSGGLNVVGKNKKLMPLWWNFPDIKTLMLDHNTFTGNLQDVPIANLSKLNHFSVGNNNLTGKVPEYLYNAKNLQWLVLSNNNFTGQSPLEQITTRLSQLTLLSIGSPDDEVADPLFEKSTIPNSVTALNKLEVLDLSNSHLFGTIPTLTSAGTGSLRHVLLHRNQLTGVIPPTLMEDNRDLETLTLYNNELVGTIPSPISAKMARIYLQGNRLAGDVPVRNASEADPIQACVLPGNGFSRNESIKNHGMPEWIPSNFSQVAFFALSEMTTFNDPDTLYVLMLYLIVSFLTFVLTAGLIVLPKAAQLINPLPSARSNIRAIATPEADAFFKFARQLFIVCAMLSVFCICNAIIFCYGAKYYNGVGGVAYNKITMTYLQSTPQALGMSASMRDWSHLTEITGAVFLTLFDIAVMASVLLLHVKGKGGSVAQWWGEKSTWEKGLSPRGDKSPDELGRSVDSSFRVEAPVDTFDWVQKRGRNLTAEMDDDEFAYRSMGGASEYSGRNSTSEYMGTYLEPDRGSVHNSPNFPAGAPTINGTGKMENLSISGPPTCSANNQRTVGAMICVAFPTVLWWLFMLLLAALVAFLKMLYYVPSNNVYNWYNPNEILLVWDALLTIVIVASNSVFIPGATQILRPMICCCEERDFIDAMPGTAPRRRRRSAPFAIVMFSRLLITVFVPVLTILVMDQHCLAFYRYTYDECAASSASAWNVSFHYPPKETSNGLDVQLTVMNYQQFCGVATDNKGECSRSMLGFLGPFYFKLLCCVAFVQPSIVLCLGRCGKRVSPLEEREQDDEDDSECFPSGQQQPKEKSVIPGCKELLGRRRLGLENQGPLLMSLFEMLMLFGAFVPPLMILGLIAICTNAIAVRFNLLTMAWQPTQSLARDVDGNLSDSLGRKPPALGWYTAVGFLLLYIFQVAFYLENHLDGVAILAIAPPVLAIITGTIYAGRRWCDHRKLKSYEDGGVGLEDSKSDPFLTTGF